MTKKRKVFSFNSQLYKVTGVQRVLMDIHRAVRDDYDARVVGTVPYERVHSDIGLSRAEYVRLRNPLMFRGAIVIVHERKFLALFWLLNHLLLQRIKIVYVHHNEFSDHRCLSVMPRTVVAISDSGVRNLTDFFRVPPEHIHKIHNCVADIHPRPHKVYGGGEVRVLYPARINSVKRQVEIVRRLDGRLSDGVKILFAGTGPDAEVLRAAVCGRSNFECLGYCSDIYRLLGECDYMMLFSEHEGLPITLIEAAMTGTPIVCNNVGGNSEVVTDKMSGFVLEKNDWNGLAAVLNSLSSNSKAEYQRMSDAARKQYLDRFTFEKFRSSYLALLSHL